MTDILLCPGSGGLRSSLRHTSIVAVTALSLALPACADKRVMSPTVDDLRDRVTVTEARLSRYFEDKVTFKLRKCWDDVKGEGRIAIRSTYTRTGSDWTWEELAVTSSTLKKEQDAIAIRCVQESVRGTSFPVAADDQARDKVGATSGARRFIVNWSFPAPLPERPSTALARATGDTGGESASCWACGHDSKLDGLCVKNAAGWPGCIETESGGCVCFGDSCAAGGYLGVGGGLILMR